MHVGGNQREEGCMHANGESLVWSVAGGVEHTMNEAGLQEVQFERCTGAACKSFVPSAGLPRVGSVVAVGDAGASRVRCRPGGWRGGS